jgi:hypothetical protein
MDENILDRLSDEVIRSSIDRCGTCVAKGTLIELCIYHHGFIKGIHVLIERINLELAKVGYVGP